MTSILDTLQRIPAEFTAVLVGALAAWLFLRYQPKAELGQKISPLLSDFAITYIVVGRLSGLIIHPTELAQLSIWTLLAQAPASGWVFGSLAGIVVLFWRLHRTGTLNRRAMYTVTNAALFALGVWLVIRLFVDHAAFLERDIALLAVTAILLFLSVRQQVVFAAHIERVWSILAVALLLISTLTPRINQFAHLTPVQWLGLLLLLGGLYVEALEDRRSLRQQKTSPKSTSVTPQGD